MNNRIKIGVWLVDADRNLLIRDGEEIAVEQKAMEVLMFLVRNQGQVVSREAILSEVWKGTYVTEDSLNRCVSLLRKAMDDTPGNPTCIKTVKGRGYELIATVSEPEQDVSVDPTPSASQHLTVPVWASVSGIILLFLLLGFLANFLLVPSNLGGTGSSWVKKPLTSQVGKEIHPAVSPDGSRFAYARFDEQSNSHHIYTEVMGAGESLRLTENSADERSPVWSPDGRYLAFVRIDGSGMGSSIWMIPSLGGPETRLVSRSVTGYTRLSWSPDGKYIAYTDRSDPEASNAIFQAEVKTGNVTRLTQATDQHWGDFSPSYSPDGRFLSFISSVSAGTQALFRQNLKDGSIRRLTPGAMRIADQTWAGRGSLLYYVTDLPEPNSIWVMNPDAPDRSRWTGITGEYPSAGRDDELLVQRTQPVQNLVEITLPDDGKKATIQPGDASPTEINSAGNDHTPVLSPDGTKLAFISDRSGQAELWMYDYKSSSLRQMTHFEGTRYLNTPAWAPDNETVTFTTYSPESHADIWVTEASNVAPRPLYKTSRLSNEIAPSWCPDGRSVVAGSNETGKWEIWKFDIFEETWTQMTQNGGYAAQCGPDNAIYYTKYDRPGIWKYEAGEDKEQLLIADPGGQLPHSWQVTTEGIIYVAASSSGPKKSGEVRYYRFNDRNTYPVQELNRNQSISGLTHSPATRKLILSVVQDRESGIYLFTRNE